MDCNSGEQHIYSTAKHAAWERWAVRPPCPDNNENVPYAPSCIKFLSGWFWHPNSNE
jgi:hypothetical protein